ncbi:hypothetical protein [Methyloceanibacter sp. wino2]|uniref:hypothetical protein n=1 Tax=Methyloceanibacter sp. wino2 TaxID=2170729 RepID=UPI00131F099C|nr:hypothetical protein [Methyloceanibacter sp. wino2]
MNPTSAFFHAMAPILTANLLTVLLLYCFAGVSRPGARGHEGYLTQLWLITMVLMFALYGFYTWRHAAGECCWVEPGVKATSSPDVRRLTPRPDNATERPKSQF